jgi:hypothetical protein
MSLEGEAGRVLPSIYAAEKKQPQHHIKINQSINGMLYKVGTVAA